MFNITGTWQTANFSKNPDIHFANMPAGATGKRVMTGSLSVPYHVSAKTDIPDVAAAFVDFIVNRDAAQTLIDNGRVPAVPTDLPAKHAAEHRGDRGLEDARRRRRARLLPRLVDEHHVRHDVAGRCRASSPATSRAQDFIDRLEQDYSEFQSSRGG